MYSEHLHLQCDFVFFRLPQGATTTRSTSMTLAAWMLGSTTCAPSSPWPSMWKDFLLLHIVNSSLQNILLQLFLQGHLLLSSSSLTISLIFLQPPGSSAEVHANRRHVPCSDGLLAGAGENCYDVCDVCDVRASVHRLGAVCHPRFRCCLESIINPSLLLHV